MNDIFHKPYAPDAGKALHFPYTQERLTERPIFPTYIFDGGASFFLLDVFHTNNSDALLEKIVSGEFYRYWYLDGAFNWSAVYHKFIRLHYTAEWEAHLWLNRLYVLLPLAQAYCRTKEKRYAAIWYDTVMHWYDANPYITYDDHPDDMVWRDMQVAWRTINLVHSIFLLDGTDALDEAQWNAVYDLIRLHANHLFKEGLVHAANHHPDNHHLQIGMALIMIGVLFPEFGQSQNCIATGRQIVEDNLQLSICRDGINNEDSLTYSHFIARLYLEAELLLTKNGLDGIPDCAQSLQKQYAFLYQFAAPDGKTLQIGDAYCMDAHADVAFVNSIYPLHFSRELRSFVYEESRMAVLRNKRFSLYVDAMDMTEWHQHYGRPNFVLFCDGEQLVCDSGSINYDRYNLRCYLNGAAGHNVIACDELPLEWELEPTDVKETLAIEGYSIEGDTKRLAISNTVSGENGKSYRWTRAFLLTEHALTIRDTVVASEAMHFISYLHLPDCRVGYYDHACKIGNTDSSKAVQAVNADSTLASLRRNQRMQSVRAQTPFTSSFCPCITRENTLGYCQLLRRDFFASEFEEETSLYFD